MLAPMVFVPMARLKTSYIAWHAPPEPLDGINAGERTLIAQISNLAVTENGSGSQRNWRRIVCAGNGSSQGQQYVGTTKQNKQIRATNRLPFS